MDLSPAAVLDPIYCYKTLEKEKIVRYFYVQEDGWWHFHIHKRAGTVDQNIKDTLDSISESSEMYIVKCGAEIAGFFVRHTEHFDYMEGFHIGAKFRTREFITEFWAIVKRVFGRSFTTAICSKNEPAVKHLLRQGFVFDGKKYFDGYVFIMLKLNQ